MAGSSGGIRLALYGILGVVGYQLAQQGALGVKAKGWVGNFKAGFSTGGAGQSQSSGVTTPSPATQAAPSGQGQATQPTGTVAYTGPSSFQGGSGPQAACQLVVQGFVQAYNLDPSDHTAAWVVYYQQQFGSWPDQDLCAGGTNPSDLYNYAVNAIGYLQSIGVG